MLLRRSLCSFALSFVTTGLLSAVGLTGCNSSDSPSSQATALPQPLASQTTTGGSPAQSPTPAGSAVPASAAAWSNPEITNLSNRLHTGVVPAFALINGKDYFNPKGEALYIVENDDSGFPAEYSNGFALEYLNGATIKTLISQTMGSNDGYQFGAAPDGAAHLMIFRRTFSSKDLMEFVSLNQDQMKTDALIPSQDFGDGFAPFGNVGYIFSSPQLFSVVGFDGSVTKQAESILTYQAA